MEVKTNVNKNNRYDVVLISTFNSLDDLEKYQKDPRHIIVSKLCENIREDRAAIDIEE